MSQTTRRIDAMKGVTKGVELWAEPVVIPTYPVMPADKNPMFLEKRVYQGSSGKVYPLPFTDRVSTEKADQSYEALHIENEYLYVMALPQFGGRIHIGFDKTKGYDFFYRQNVIKPALVGLAGPWISGGVEFNWPQHHRPATFMPVEYYLEEHEDGSKTIWLSDHDPMSGLKGMHGVCLHPGKSFLELKVRLYNRTPWVQTFLWWANVAARSHEKYQSFFPPDVHHIADHAKRAVETFPGVTSHYYGVDYGARLKNGVPAEETPRQFVPDGSYAANRLDWYANIPVPTSYMALRTEYDFAGGYDHAAGAGFVHVANRHIAPGKKQWTWGNQEFGYAWDRNLTDEDGPYVELMAGVFTDNQPDFSFLAPYETKTFRQIWYPLQEIGPAVMATVDAALAWDEKRIGVCTSARFETVSIRVLQSGKLVWERQADVEPGKPFLAESPGFGEGYGVVVSAADGRELVAYAPKPPKDEPLPDPATEPALPMDVPTNEELYTVGLHLEQYRHATRMAESYWQEAIRRDPNDSRCLNALGRWRLKRGEYAQAEELLRRAVASITRRNPNPYDGEPYYNLGMTLERQGRLDEAYAAYYKATWNYTWKGAAFFAVARLDLTRRDLALAREHAEECLRVLADHNGARCVLAAIERVSECGSVGSVPVSVGDALALDPLDHWALNEAALIDPSYASRRDAAMRGEARYALELAIDYGSCGLYEEAIEVLNRARSTGYPMVGYAIAFYLRRAGAPEEAVRTALEHTKKADPSYCNPHRLEEIEFLSAAIEADTTDARAPYFLGNLFYDRKRYDEAIVLWERAAELEPTNSVAWRNLGIAYWNVRRDPGKAKEAYERAILANPDDARLIFERDQLWKRLGVSPQERIGAVQAHGHLVELRDDLTLEMAALYNAIGRPEEARRLLGGRQFQPWEGGEGLALGQHARTQVALARKAGGSEAVAALREALNPPHNLGEARHLLANQSDLWFEMGETLAAVGETAEAKKWWTKAAEFKGDFQEMSVRTFSEMTYYRALSLRRLGRDSEATELLRGLSAYADELERSTAKIDYFATSLPTMLLFDDDLQERQTTTARFLRAQAAYGLGDKASAKCLLQDVLARDPNHALAQDLSREASGS